MKLEQIAIPAAILAEMRQHANRCLPNEACGMLGGTDGRISLHIPVSNMLESPKEFRMEPEEQLLGLIELENRKLDLAAIYHSHPTGKALPSETDLKSHHYPDSICIILAKKEPEWDIQAFWIIDGRYASVMIETV